jgi:hypothetical protein
MREEETLTWSAGGDGDNGEALAGQLCFLSSVPSSAFLFLLFGFFFSLGYVLSPSVIPPLCFFLFLSSGSSFFFGLQGAIENDDISVGFLGFFVCVFSVFFRVFSFFVLLGFFPLSCSVFSFVPSLSVSLFCLLPCSRSPVFLCSALSFSFSQFFSVLPLFMLGSSFLSVQFPPPVSLPFVAFIAREDNVVSSNHKV